MSFSAIRSLGGSLIASGGSGRGSFVIGVRALSSSSAVDPLADVSANATSDHNKKVKISSFVFDIPAKSLNPANATADQPAPSYASKRGQDLSESVRAAGLRAAEKRAEFIVERMKKPVARMQSRRISLAENGVKSGNGEIKSSRKPAVKYTPTLRELDERRKIKDIQFKRLQSAMEKETSGVSSVELDSRNL